MPCFGPITATWLVRASYVTSTVAGRALAALGAKPAAEDLLDLLREAGGVGVLDGEKLDRDILRRLIDRADQLGDPPEVAGVIGDDEQVLLRDRETAGAVGGEERLEVRIDAGRFGVAELKHLRQNGRPRARRAAASAGDDGRAACMSGITRFQPGCSASTSARPFIFSALSSSIGTALFGTRTGALIVTRWAAADVVVQDVDAKFLAHVFEQDLERRVIGKIEADEFIGRTRVAGRVPCACRQGGAKRYPGDSARPTTAALIARHHFQDSTPISQPECYLNRPSVARTVFRPAMGSRSPGGRGWEHV